MSSSGYHSAVIALDHIQLAMPKGEERLAEEFYCDLLGFQRVNKPNHLEQHGGCWFTASGVNLHLGVDRQFVPARKAHPGFVVNSLTTLKKQSRYVNVGDHFSGFIRARGRA